MRIEIPEYVKEIMSFLPGSYVVGGCVRDSILGVKPKDWDIATPIHPDLVLKVLVSNMYDVIPTGIKYGTVTIVRHPSIDIVTPVEITTFRRDGVYRDGRHPEDIHFADTIEEDLARRDFTMNAIAVSADGGIIVDPYHGLFDIQYSEIRAVGDPEKRFEEDALRMWRAVRFVSTLGPRVFHMDGATYNAIYHKKHLTAFVSRERIRDELMKTIKGPCIVEAMYHAFCLGLVQTAIPELAVAYLYDQKNPHHFWRLHNHLIFTAEITHSLAGFLHDVGKPYCATWDDEKEEQHFYGHDMLGGVLTKDIMERLKFSSQEIGYTSALVTHHMFPFCSAGPSAYRRLAAKASQYKRTFTSDLLRLHVADVESTGTEKLSKEKIEEYKEKLKKAHQDVPTKKNPMKINGNDITSILGIKPSPEIGRILTALNEFVLDNPEKNNYDDLRAYAKDVYVSKVMGK